MRIPQFRLGVATLNAVIATASPWKVPRSTAVDEAGILVGFSPKHTNQADVGHLLFNPQKRVAVDLALCGYYSGMAQIPMIILYLDHFH